MAGSVPLGITGATGHVGGRVAELLAAAGVPTRLLVRDPARARASAAAEVAVCTYGDRDVAEAALSGVETLFMTSAAEAPDRLRQHKTFLDAAKTAGVRHVVYLSFITAKEDSVFLLGRDHWHTEEHLRASGLKYTMLQDNLYADFLPDLAGADGVIRGPGREGRIAAVARADVADAVVAVLRNPQEHADTAYGLTGPQALTLAEIADLITRSTGRRTTYDDETTEEAYASRAVYGAPTWQVDAWVSTYTGIAAGEFDVVTDHVPALTGHPATPLEAVLRGLA